MNCYGMGRNRKICRMDKPGYRLTCVFYFPLYSILEFFPVVLKLLELFHSVRQDPRTKLQTTAQYCYLPVSPKFKKASSKQATEVLPK